MKRNNLIFLILAIIISSVGILPLFHLGFFLTDDGNSMIIRFSAFYETLRSGQFPVRFISRLNFGYGYPVSDFLYPLFMYIGIPIKALGFSFVDTIKIILGLSFLSGAIFSFLWLRKLFDEKAAFVGTAAYSLFPYHLFDIYKRGSVGEILALGIVPFIFWAIEENNIVLISIGYGLLITSHNTLALIFAPIILLYQILFKKNISRVLISFAGGLGLSAFFWIPALYDKQFTVFDAIKVSNYKDYFINLQTVYLTGLIFIIPVVFRLFYFFKKNRLLQFFLIISLISFFMTTGFSDIFWRLLPFPSFVQFPFRFLSPAVLSTAFLISHMVFHYKGKAKNFFILILFLIIFISAKDLLISQTFQNHPDTFYSTNQDSTTVKNEYMPKWVKIIPLKNTPYLAEPKQAISYLYGNSNNMSFKVSTNKNIAVEVQKVYFPGWKASVDGKEAKIIYNNPKGLIQIKIIPGDHIVHVYFQEDGLRLISDLISLISVITLFVYFMNIVKIGKK